MTGTSSLSTFLRLVESNPNGRHGNRRRPIRPYGRRHRTRLSPLGVRKRRLRPCYRHRTSPIPY